MSGAQKDSYMARESLGLDNISGQELTDVLREWAVDEMRFRPQGRHVNAPLPASVDFQRLCRGTMVDVWKFVIKHVKSAQTLQKIRGNLQLQRLLYKHQIEKFKSGGSNAREQLQDEYNQRNRELIDIRTKISHMLREIKHLEKDILATEQAYNAVCQEMSDNNKRSDLLTVYSRQCSNIGYAYQDLSKQIKNRLGAHRDIEKKSSAEPTYYAVQRDISQCTVSGIPARSNGQSMPSGLESACTRAVREACEAIGSYLQQVCESDVQETKEQPEVCKRKTKDHLWTEVEMILSQHPPWRVLSSLAVTTQDSASSLRELAGRIHLKRDAEELKFMYEKGGKLTDTSRPPTLLQSVHQLIEEGQAVHFQRFLDSERALNQTWKARKTLQSLHHDMDSRLMSRYRGMPGSTDLARELYQCELELAASRASLAYLQISITELNQSRTERNSVLETIHAKHKKIEDFEKLAQAKQSIIQVLVKQNFAARARLEKQTLELQHYVQDKVCLHQAHVSAMASQLNEGFSREVNKFASLPLTRLMYADMQSGQRVPVDDLSIYRLEGLQGRPGGTAISSVLNILEFPTYKAPEDVLLRAVEIKKDMEDTALLVNSRHRDISQVDERKSAENVVSHLKTLRHEVQHQDSLAMEQVLPRVQDSLSKATRALSDCITVKNSANSWWEQPAQFVIPWTKVNGMNMRQWDDQWTLNATRLRQLQMYQ